MEFGRVPVEQLSAIDFTLPEPPAGNALVLPDSPAAAPKIYLGCPSWARAEWAGKVYPAKANSTQYLQHYVRQFNCIELNATHYKLYDNHTIQQWASKAKGKDFKFCPKFYQGITHDGLLTNKQALIRAFIDGISNFGEHLGPMLIQLSDSFSPARQTELFAFLNALPLNQLYFLELRHLDWFNAAGSRHALFSQLQQLGIGAVITDTASRRDCAHLQLSIPKAFVRFVGNSLHPTDYTRADAWVAQAKKWLDAGLEELYFFIHMQDELTSPDLVQYLAAAFSKHTGVNVASPVYEVRQKSLFN